jgi:hypothetical protein
MAIVIDDAKALPKCDSGNERQLVFARDVGLFFSCEAGSWVDVPIGKNGEPGPAGPKGDIGAQGVAGSKGDKGDPGKPSSGNLWYDAMTDQLWLMAGKVNRNMSSQVNNVDNSCTGDWRLPNIAEAKTAALHGIHMAMDSYGTRWTYEIITSEFLPHDTNLIEPEYRSFQYIHDKVWPKADSPTLYRTVVSVQGDPRGSVQWWTYGGTASDVVCLFSPPAR